MFDDLHDPNPPSAGLDALAAVSKRAQHLRRRRSLLIGGGGLAVVALAVAALVLPGRDDDRVAPIDEATTTGVSASMAPSTSFDAPSSTEPISTNAESPDPCRDVPSPPVWLVDGSSPGEAAIRTDADGAMTAQWGDDAVAVMQVAPRPDSDSFEIVDGTEQLVTAGTFRAAVVPVDDPPLSPIGISLDDGNCEREYVVGPGIELADAIAYAQDWVDALEVDASLSINTTSTDICVSVPLQAMSWCEPLDSDGSTGLTGLTLDRSDVWVVTAVAPNGSSFESPSSIARSSAIPGTDKVHLIDVRRAGSCAAISTPDGPAGGCKPVGPAAVAKPLVAINGDGDAVVFDENNVASVIYDGTDPDDPAPQEGEVTFVDGVAVTPDGSAVIVGVCCEPVPGSLMTVDLSTGTSEFLAFGHLPIFTSYGNLVWTTFGPVNIGGADASIATTLIEFDPVEGTVADLAVVNRTPEPEEVLAIVASPDGTYLWRGYVGGGDMDARVKISDATWTDDAQLSLAGWGDGAFYVLDGANDRLLSFDAVTLQGIPSDQDPVDWISAWVMDDSERWVTADRRLVVEGEEIPGAYLWVR